MSDDDLVFGKIPIVGDPRVSPVMTHCTKCGEKLPDAQTAGESGTMVLFTQCPKCHAVMIQDIANFGPSCDS